MEDLQDAEPSSSRAPHFPPHHQRLQENRSSGASPNLNEVGPGSAEVKSHEEERTSNTGGGTAEEKRNWIQRRRNTSNGGGGSRKATGSILFLFCLQTLQNLESRFHFTPGHDRTFLVNKIGVQIVEEFHFSKSFVLLIIGPLNSRECRGVESFQKRFPKVPCQHFWFFYFIPIPFALIVLILKPHKDDDDDGRERWEILINLIPMLRMSQSVRGIAEFWRRPPSWRQEIAKKWKRKKVVLWMWFGWMSTQKNDSSISWQGLIRRQDRERSDKNTKRQDRAQTFPSQERVLVRWEMRSKVDLGGPAAFVPLSPVIATCVNFGWFRWWLS